jgi:hypothetical protein
MDSETKFKAEQERIRQTRWKQNAGAWNKNKTPDGKPAKTEGKSDKK